MPRIGITGDFPERFRYDERTQLGAGYDNFEKLEELSKKGTGAGNTEYKEAEGI